ncbi:hypothetical protein HanIR_Chr11g0513201 [Helianthus annuus]|nr:hypothetical protein HanIR_Chr11g0513201 [Helianthus annuus]
MFIYLVKGIKNCKEKYDHYYYIIYKIIFFCLDSFRPANLNEICISGSSSGSITKRALFQARARARAR